MMSKLSPEQIKKVEDLDQKIEKLDELDSMSSTQIERTVKAFSAEGVKLRNQRKDIRYKLYRLRTEKAGKCASGQTKKFRKKFENQPFFDGWHNFAVTWDVAFDDPFRIVHRKHSELEEWDEVVKAKFPVIKHGGKVEYPDIKVRKAVEAHRGSN